MGREGQERISPTIVLVVVLCSAFYVDLLIISTTVFAQGTNTRLNNQSTISASDQQSEIAIVDKIIVPANKATVKGNVTVISATNNTIKNSE